MRIAVVSAHYPPDFVSGGTLVPQRLARGLAARHHDVRVYAGSLDRSQAPLTTWEDRDLTGLPVHWIATWPWVEWSERGNYDNPGVAADFAGWLAGFAPDVVHLHSLQTLGCGVVEAAVATGAEVVVTMHDFWWVCGRQFLADRSYRPCCLVVAAGDCPCQVNRLWLDKRTARLARALDGVAAVLVPSAAAARVLEANGVAPGRIEVDENGLAAPEPTPGGVREPPAAGGPAGGQVRLVYAGGADRMKGSDVLVAAAAELAGRSGWRLTAYGLDPATVPPGLPIDVVAPFAEGDLAAVLAQADVLVLPSVMRETFSILTREALAAGVPVIVTDTLGPEEVVVDGGNGLIVPAGDPGALAGAIGRLLDDPELLADLRRSASAVPFRSIEDQVRANEALYRRLPPSRPTQPRRINQVVFAVGIDGAPLRYRARLPAEGLALHGVQSAVVHYRDPDLPALLARADAAVFYRVPATTQVLDLIAAARGRGCPVMFDVDDLIFDPEIAAEIPAVSILPPAESALWLEGVRRYRTTMEACDLFVGSTEPLCRHAARVTGMPTERFANGVGRTLGRLSDRASASLRPDGPLRMGYFSGTTTHDQDWALIEDVVLDALARHPNLELWLVGHLTLSPAIEGYRDRIHVRPVVPWTELPARLRAVDINLVPLVVDSRFNQAKSAIKWLEAGLVGTPTIASPTQPYQEVIIPHLTGLLAGTQDEWAGAIDLLVQQSDQRAAMGRRARRAALLGWSPHLQGRRYLDILERAAEYTRQGERRKPSSGWVPVTLDEPFIPSPLEPYQTVVPRLTAAASRPPRVGRLTTRTVALARRAHTAQRRHGSAQAARRAARVVKRRLVKVLRRTRPPTGRKRPNR